MIVYNFYVYRIPFIPFEANSPLLIDPNTVLILSFGLVMLFQPIAGTGKVAEFCCPVEYPKLAQGGALNVMGQTR